MDFQACIWLGQVGTVKIAIWTHKIDGLNEADFIFAAKADGLV